MYYIVIVIILIGIVGLIIRLNLPRMKKREENRKQIKSENTFVNDKFYEIIEKEDFKMVTSIEGETFMMVNLQDFYVDINSLLDQITHNEGIELEKTIFIYEFIKHKKNIFPILMIEETSFIFPKYSAEGKIISFIYKKDINTWINKMNGIK